MGLWYFLTTLRPLAKNELLTERRKRGVGESGCTGNRDSDLLTILGEAPEDSMCRSLNPTPRMDQLADYCRNRQLSTANSNNLAPDWLNNAAGESRGSPDPMLRLSAKGSLGFLANLQIPLEVLGVDVTTGMVQMQTNTLVSDMFAADPQVLQSLAKFTIFAAVPHPLVKSVHLPDVECPA